MTSVHQYNPPKQSWENECAQKREMNKMEICSDNTGCSHICQRPQTTYKAAHNVLLTTFSARWNPFLSLRVIVNRWIWLQFSEK